MTDLETAADTESARDEQRYVAHWPEDCAERAAELEAALTAWWKPQRHVDDCACEACTLTRAALERDTQ